MYPISDAFKEAVKKPHTMVARCEVLNSNFVVQKVLRPEQGNVSVDEDDDTRRSCTASIMDPNGSLTPDEASDLLHPNSGNMLRMFRGLILPNGQKEFVSLGIFDIADADIMDPGEYVRINFRGFDFSHRVAANTFDTQYVIAAGTRFDLAIRDLISSRVSGLNYNFPVVPFVTPQITFDTGDNPWAKARELAKSIGYDLWFDVQGFCRLTPIPYVDSENVVDDYEEDGDHTRLLYVNKRISSEETFNTVYARSSSSQLDEPVIGFAEVTDIDSPYHYTKIGRRSTTITSEHIRTQEQADELAAARLRQTASTRQAMQVIAITNPAHEAGDVVRVRRSRIHVNALYVFKSFNINLHPWQSMNVSMREIRQ